MTLIVPFFPSYGIHPVGLDGQTLLSPCLGTSAANGHRQRLGVVVIRHRSPVAVVLGAVSFGGQAARGSEAPFSYFLPARARRMASRSSSSRYGLLRKASG